MVKIIFFSLLLIYSFPLFPQQDYSNWETYFEKSGFNASSRYAETMEYFQRLADYSDYADFTTFGISPQKRELKCLVVSKNKLFNFTEAKKVNKPIVLIINGIHSGEIEGKDASMLLLRQMLITKEKEYLLDSLILLVVPIFSVDGHERTSKYSRINQNGPEEMGWRTTAQNLNLNRDWMKADAPEMQAMLKLMSDWLPDFVIDTHTTDGADYQYIVTYSIEWSKNIYVSTGNWLKNKFVPYLENSVDKKGFLISPYVYLRNWDKGFDEGLIYWAATPRFSTGYSAIQNRPALLIETHMIKPYKERVFATKAVLETTLNFVHNNSAHLLELNKEADENSIKLYSKEGNYLHLSYDVSDSSEILNFKGYEYYWEPSKISGSNKIIYTEKKKQFPVKYYSDIIVTDSVKVPKGYLIPIEWSDLYLNKLTINGIKSEFKTAGEVFFIERYNFSNVKYDSASYEGRQRVNFDLEIEKEKITLNEDMIFVPTNQRTVRVIVNLLEPKSADSFVRWGFMNQIFEQKEYYEDYVMEKLAEEMLENEPGLKREFGEKLESDEVFRNNTNARLDFFYERSPYPDKQLNVYPILRVE